MNWLFWNSVINVIIFFVDLILIFMFFKFMNKNENIQPVLKQTESIIRAWGKSDKKKKPKANDDTAAWRKENNIE